MSKCSYISLAFALVVKRMAQPNFMLFFIGSSCGGGPEPCLMARGSVVYEWR